VLGVAQSLDFVSGLRAQPPTGARPRTPEAPSRKRGGDLQASWGSETDLRRLAGRSGSGIGGGGGGSGSITGADGGWMGAKRCEECRKFFCMVVLYLPGQGLTTRICCAYVVVSSLLIFPIL